MRLVCLCPTYKKTHMPGISWYLFNQQTYKDAILYILDDGNSFIPKTEDNLILEVTDKRFPTLPEKYNYMAQTALNSLNADGIVVWEDDDIYLQNHLETVAKGLEKHRWVHPTRGFSVYGGSLNIDIYTGRMHAALAMRRDIFTEYDIWWPVTKGQHFDLQLLKRLAQDGHPKYDPWEDGLLTYLFRWSAFEGYHAQYFMKGDDEWYDRIEDARKHINDNRSIELKPYIENETQKILDLVAKYENGEIELPYKIE